MTTRRFSQAFSTGAALLAASLALTAGVPASAAEDAGGIFDKLKQLEGRWQGTFEWSGSRQGSGPATVDYRVIARGTAVIETLFPGHEAEMTTVYHVDGSDLRATHYCARGNQPRLRAERPDDGGRVALELVDVTSLSGPDDGHVVRITLDLDDPERLVLALTFRSGEQLGTETLTLTRTQP